MDGIGFFVTIFFWKSISISVDDFLDNHVLEGSSFGRFVATMSRNLQYDRAVYLLQQNRNFIATRARREQINCGGFVSLFESL